MVSTLREKSLLKSIPSHFNKYISASNRTDKIIHPWNLQEDLIKVSFAGRSRVKGAMIELGMIRIKSIKTPIQKFVLLVNAKFNSLCWVWTSSISKDWSIVSYSNKLTI